MDKIREVDIIIPIYNAYDDLQICVSSILKCTDTTKHRLILVNDASPDKRISPYIKSLEKEHVLAVENKENLGFSGSINRGIKVSGDRDVILLNSDTIVTSNWVEKIIECAYSDESIATVTPLSNNATLCSVPEFLTENQLPEGYSLERYADLIETVSMRLYPRIPVANGFCMFIKREVIEKIGLFDMDTFQRGYGEENDFCYRAEQVGYHHVMCDNTYIYHTGTTSFVSDEKRKYIEEHQKILTERYPEQDHAVAVHCRDNPNGHIQENIKIWTELLNNRKNILYMVHSDFREDASDHLGGTQLHVKDLTTIMRAENNVFVIARDLDYLNLTAYTKDKEYFFRFYIGYAPKYQMFRDNQFAKLYGKILDVFHIDLVHIHHTKDLSLEMYYQAELRNVPIVSTLHDYYTICPSVKMIDYKGELCINKTMHNCQECHQRITGVRKTTDYIAIWKNEHERVLRKVAVIITPSESAKKIICTYYPELREKMIAIPHGVEIMDCKNYYSSKKLHVAFVGGISKEKGSFVSSELVKKGPSDIQWYLFGTWGNNELSNLEKNNYTKIGPYERNELPELISKHKIDVICNFPIWPETFCYTLSEAIMCGVPVIATDIGALGERMKEMDCGWLVSTANTYIEALEIINRIKDKGIEYQEKKENVQKIRLKDLDEMGVEYSCVYEKLFDARKKMVEMHSMEQYRFIMNAYKIAHRKNYNMQKGEERIYERMHHLETRLDAITNSFTYKVMCALRLVPTRVRKFIRKIMEACYRMTNS